MAKMKISVSLSFFLGAKLHFSMLISTIILFSTTSTTHAVERSFDYDKPRGGPHCLRILAGDTVKLHWDEYHDLHKLNSENAYRDCNFNNAPKLKSANPNEGGHVVGPFSAGQTAYYSCSKICRSNGHKVKICAMTADQYNSDAESACPCPEGTPLNFDQLNFSFKRGVNWWILFWTKMFVFIFNGFFLIEDIVEFM